MAAVRRQAGSARVAAQAANHLAAEVRAAARQQGAAALLVPAMRQAATRQAAMRPAAMRQAAMRPGERPARPLAVEG